MALCAPTYGQSKATREFGFGLNPTAQGEFYSLFIYTVLDNVVVGSVPMRTEPFILQASGLQESSANLEMVDLFDAYGIPQCGAWTEAGELRTGFDCPAIRNLWKLRYQKEMVPDEGLGWAGEPFCPSPRQQILLQHYRAPGYEHWHGPYFGKDAFRLLRDLQDPEWVHTFRGT